MGELDHCCGKLSCDWRGSFSDALTATHPFKDGKTIQGCPKCGTIGVWVACQIKECQEPGATRAAPDEKLCGGPFFCDYHWKDKEARKKRIIATEFKA